MKNFILCKPNRKTLCVLNGVQLDSVSYTPKLNDLDEIAFTVDRYIIDDDGNKIISQGYDQIHAFMEVYIDGIGYFQIKEPQVSNDGNKETKSVTGVSTDCELLQKDLVGFTVNKTTANSLEMLADNNVNSLGYPNEYITFYNKNNPQLSLIDLVLEKASGWKVGFIDESLKNQRFVFDDINENILSFLTKTLSSTAKCIFEFNTVDKTVSAYSENNIGEDTGIIIAYRNLLNNVDMSCNSDNIFTRLNVQGRDSLTFSDINYGDTHVSNLDYYKNTNYMDDKLIAKLDMWEQARNDNREDYISKVKIYHDYIEQISEIDNKVPTNGVLNNWDNMSMDELTKNQTYYNSLIKSFQITAQNAHPQGSETIYTGNLDDYSPSRLNPDGTVDHEAYMADLDGQGKETYREIITYVLPNIQIAIDNFDKTATEKSDYLTGYLTEWDLYGIVELKAKQSSYEEQLNTLKNYVKNWSDLTDEEKASHGNNQDNYELYHNEYIKIDGYLSEIASKFTELDTQKQSLITSRDVVQSELKQIRTDMAMTGGRIVDGVYTNWFSDDEVELINLLFHDTDYTNENILTTSLDDFNKQLEIEQELYDDAVAQLDELSIPQYSFSCELDNLLDIEEFKEWKDDFKVGNFITLEVSPNCFTKLRLISISYNPCIKTNDLTVEFSNMVTTKSGRNDFSYIFDKAISVAKNSITYSNNSNKDSIELSTELLNLLSNSSVFQGKFDNLELNTLLSNEIQVVKLTADYAKINELETKYATVDFANITEAAISKIQAIDIDASKITTGTLIADRILLKAPVGSENEGLLYAINNFGDLTSTSVDTIDGYILTERTINADKIIASSITTNELDVNQIFANSAVLSTLTAQQAFINAISTNTVVVSASQQASKALGIANTANENVNKSINGITIHYLATSSSSGVTINTAGWTTTPQSMTSDKKYLWTYQTMTDIAGKSTNSTPVISGVYGDKGATGNGINSITYYYATTTTQTAPSASSITSTSIPALSATNKYLWQKEVIDYTDSSIADKTSVILLAVYGDTGNKGDTGISVTKAIPLYYASNSITAPNAPTSAVTSTSTSANVWTTIQPAFNKTYPYIYVCTQVGFSNNTYSWSNVTIERSLSQMANWCSANDVTLLDGGKIYTGSINADKIIANSITTNELNVNEIFANSAVLTKLTAQDAFIEAISTNSIVVDASSKINNLEIGGVNLLLNTKPFAMASSTSLSGALLSGLPISNGNYYRGFLIRGNTITSSVTEVCRYNFTDFSLGDTFTFSFYAKGDVTELRAFFYGASGCVQVAKCVNSQGEVNTNSDGRCSFAVSDGWERYWVTWTLKTTGNTSVPKYVMIRTNNAVSGQTVYICGCKLEKGNKITDWTPAVEDTETAISDASIANWCYNNNKTYIDGAKIYTGTITADAIAAKSIKSGKIDVSTLSAISANLGTVTAGIIQNADYEKDTKGMKISLDDGTLDSKNFSIDAQGNVTVNGVIYATHGTLSNLLIVGDKGIACEYEMGAGSGSTKQTVRISEGKISFSNIYTSQEGSSRVDTGTYIYQATSGIAFESESGEAYFKVSSVSSSALSHNNDSYVMINKQGLITSNGTYLNSRDTDGNIVRLVALTAANHFHIGSPDISGTTRLICGNSNKIEFCRPESSANAITPMATLSYSSTTVRLYMPMHFNFGTDESHACVRQQTTGIASTDFVKIGNSAQLLQLIGNTITSTKAITTSSDARMKNHIADLPSKSENLFDYLDGKSFFYNGDNSTAKNYGFIAQDVLSALQKCGLTTNDFAGFCDINGDGSQYALAYEQFIPIMWNEIKRLRNQVKELKGE